MTYKQKLYLLVKKHLYGNCVPCWEYKVREMELNVYAVIFKIILMNVV